MSDYDNYDTDQDMEVVSEADAASNMATIAAKPTNVSRSDLIAKMVAYATKASKEDLSSFISSIGGDAEENDEVPENDALYGVSKNAQNAVGDKSAQNAASIKSSGKHADPMPSVKEDLEMLFGGSEDLTEDFRLKVSTLFEAAVSTRVNIESTKIEERYEALHEELAQQYETSLEESVNEIKNEMVENVDDYLNYAVAEWMAENKMAVKNKIGRAHV